MQRFQPDPNRWLHCKLLQVASGSLADRAGLKENDHLSQIAGRSAENMGHTDAQNAIMSAGNNLTLNVTR